MDDMVAKKRSSQGSRHTKKLLSRDIRGHKNKASKLTEDDVSVILKLKSEGMTNIAIAERFPVSSVAIGNIFRGFVWNHITGFEYRRETRGKS